MKGAMQIREKVKNLILSRSKEIFDKRMDYLFNPTSQGLDMVALLRADAALYSA